MPASTWDNGGLACTVRGEQMELGTIIQHHIEFGDTYLGALGHSARHLPGRSCCTAVPGQGRRSQWLCARCHQQESPCASDSRGGTHTLVARATATQNHVNTSQGHTGTRRASGRHRFRSGRDPDVTNSQVCCEHGIKHHVAQKKIKQTLIFCDVREQIKLKSISLGKHNDIQIIRRGVAWRGGAQGRGQARTWVAGARG